MTLEEEIKYCVNLLKAGKVILYPTDTIWGIGCDATNTKAVERIYKIKQREARKSMIILLDDEQHLEKYVKNVPPIAYDLISNSASPITIVYPEAQNISKKLIAKDGSIAIRIPKDRFASQVARHLGHPLVSTSANISGMPVAPTFSMINAEVISKVDYVVRHYREKTHAMKPSTVIRLEEDGRFTVLRP